ncbi:hypothetical protein GGE24_007307 [Bradyrhizobium centrosematis]|nr:hypothetical protein [Bradyrhizobium centrosematis]MCS3777932.1 hypothetical protein [Bradyrhizobium centrosematis]
MIAAIKRVDMESAHRSACSRQSKPNGSPTPASSGVLPQHHHYPDLAGSQRHSFTRAWVGHQSLLRGDVPIGVELRRADVAGMNVTRPSRRGQRA